MMSKAKHTPPSTGFKKFRELLFKHAPHDLFNELSWEEKAELNRKPREWNAPPLGTVTKESEIQYDTYLQGDRVHVGGVSGGSCWESSNPQPYSIDDAESAELQSLDKLLEDLCPAITFLQYKKLMSIAGVETHGEEEHEYYGNCSNYIRKRVQVGKLYDALCELKALKPEQGGE